MLDRVTPGRWASAQNPDIVVLNVTKLTFLGAARTVTGSKYLLEHGGKRVLFDCGLFQGLKDLRLRNWADFPVPPRSLDAVVLTHAHLDHVGYLPRLTAQGYKGRIFCTPGTKDLCQLVIGERIVTYNRREQKILDEAAVVEKFGIHPESIPDYLALVGDTADGVPGLPGWGAKSAATVLARYPRLELIPADPAKWEVSVRSADKLAATLREHVEEAFLYRELTTLRLDVPIAETLDDLEWRGVPAEIFEAFCRGVGLDPEAIRVHRWAD